MGIGDRSEKRQRDRSAKRLKRREDKWAKAHPPLKNIYDLPGMKAYLSRGKASKATVKPRSGKGLRSV